LERFFTDAEEARGRFRELLESTPLPKRIVVVHGIGAVGKSSLLRMFRLYCRRSQVPVALVGAEDAPSVVAILERWGADLRGSGVELPAFEDTLRRYHEVQSRVDAEAAKAGEAQADAAAKLGTAAAKGAIKLAASAGEPAWSPDGRRIAFFADRNGSDDIYVMNADGSGQIRLTTTGTNFAPTWSPDGTQILYMCRIPANPPPPPGSPPADFELCVINADGSGFTRLTDNPSQELTPTWSPDGQRIAFHRPVAGRFQLFTMNADGTGTQQLTNTLGLNLFASWGELRVKSG
jgi:dipeptidyl aminopeptidase/acylaminoacyl peptidase